MKRIERQAYLQKLISFKDKKLIKVITGIRRCGKSTIMEIFRDWLKAHGVMPEQIIYLNLEDYDYYELRDPQKLYAYIKPLILQDKMTYIFFDEIQHVRDFPDIINSLNLKSMVDLYVTGSNAYMLSSEIATLLSGRYVEIAMLPLSFKEYVEGIGGTDDLSQTYMEYVSKSSFPYTLELDTANEVSDYLNAVYNTIVVKDIMSRNKFSDVMMLESVIRFTADNIGNILSTKRIADLMTADGRKIDQKTVENTYRPFASLSSCMSVNDIISRASNCSRLWENIILLISGCDVCCLALAPLMLDVFWRISSISNSCGDKRKYI